MKKSAANALPERLHVSIGGHFGTSFCICLEGGLLTYEWSKSVQNFPPKWDCWSEQIQPTEERWQAFRAALDRLTCGAGSQGISNRCATVPAGAQRSSIRTNRLFPVVAIAIQEMTEGRSRSPADARMIPSNNFVRQFRIWSVKTCVACQ